MTTKPDQQPPTQSAPDAEDYSAEDKALWAEFDELEGEKPGEDGADADPPPAAAAAGRDDDGNADAWGERDGTGEEDDGAAAAAQSASGETAPPAQTTTTEAPAAAAAGKPAGTTTEPAATTSAAPPADPLARLTSMSEEQRAAFEAAYGFKPDVLVHEVRSNRGRISALTRDLNEARRGRTAPTASPTTTNPAAPAAPPADPTALLASETWKKLEEEYGEIAGPLKDVLGPILAEHANLKRFASMVDEDKRTAYQKEQDGIVLNQHPDFETVVGSQDFGAWAQTQPEYIKAALRRNSAAIVDGEEAAHVVAQYKLARGIPLTRTAAPDPASAAPASGAATTATPPARGAGTQQSSAGRSARRDAQLRSANAPSSRSPGVVQGGEPQTEEQAWDYWEKREKQQEGARRRA